MKNQKEIPNQTTNMYIIMYCYSIIPNYSIIEDNCKSDNKLQSKCCKIEFLPKYCSIDKFTLDIIG